MVNEVFLDASHGLCGYHMKQNLKKYKNEKVTNIFQHALRVYHPADFVAQSKELKKIHREAYNYLNKVDVRKWSHAYSLVRCYSLMTSNIAESMNSALRHARKFSVMALVEFNRSLMQTWFYDRQNAAKRTNIVLTYASNLQLTKNSNVA